MKNDSRSVGTAIQSAGPQIIGDTCGGRKQHYLVGGEQVALHTGEPNNEHEVESLDDLIRFATHVSPETCYVWHSHDSVVLTLNDYDQVTFDLPNTGQYTTLLKSCENSAFSQPQFIRMLKRNLGVDETIVSQFRRLDFKVIQAAEGDIQHGKDRMGKSIQAEVKGTAELPESITVSIPIYNAIGERAPESILCGIDLDPQRSQILFAPLPGELDIAIDNRQADIRKRLVEGLGEGTRIYRGRP